LKQKLIIAIVCSLSLISVEEVEAQMIFDTLMLNELQVLGYKKDYSLSYKKTSIDSLMKEKLNYLDLGELLGGYTPVFIKSYGRGSLSTASFRGTGASHTQVQWDDFTLNSPMLGQVDLSLIPNSFFNEVNLYYGGGSLLKSSGALGGTVTLNNTSFFPQKPVLFIEQMAGSFNSFSTSAGLSIGKNKFSSSTRFSYQTSENDFSYYNDSILPAREVTQEDAEFSNFGFTQSFNFKPSIHHLITLSSWNQWNKRNIPPIMTNISNPLKEEQNDVFSRNIISWIYQENNSHLEIKAAWFYEELIYEMNTDGSLKDSIVNSQNITNSIGVKAKYEHIFPKGFRISTGVSYDHEYVITNNYDGRKDRDRLSLYGAIVKDFAGRFKVNLLLRSELVDEAILPVMPLLGFNYKILKNEDLFVRGSVSRNYHVPTLNDLYWYPGGNKDLAPEESYELEGGLNYIKPIGNQYSLGTDFSAYASRINDWIQWVPSNNGYWSPENINEVYARGVEISANLSKTGRFNFRVFVEYAYTKTTNESPAAKEAGTAGQQLIYIPVQTANAFVYAGFKGFYFTYNQLYTGVRNTMMSNTGKVQAVLPAYWMSDLSLGKTFSKKTNKFDIRFKINNLFDVSYQAVRLRAMPGRNYEVFIKYSLN